MGKYGPLLNTLLAVTVAGVGYQVVLSGGDWASALDALGVTVLTALIKVLNPTDGDVGVKAKK
jgi:hypothetical protein